MVDRQAPLIEPETDDGKDSRFSLVAGVRNVIARAGVNPPVPHNSLFFSVCMSISAMLGIGILNQAYVFYDAGVLGGLLVYAVCVWFIYAGEVIPVRVGLRINVLEYDHLSETLCGNFGLYLSIISTFFFALLDVIAMINVIGSLVTDLITDDGEELQYLVTTLLVIFVMGPICLFRHYGHFAELTVFAVTLITILVFYVAIGGPVLHEEDSDKEDGNSQYDSPIVWFRPLGIVRQIGSVMFAMDFGCSIFPIFQSLENPTYKRWTVSTKLGTAIATTFLMVVGLAGYLSFRDETSGDIVENFPTDLRFMWLYLCVLAHTLAFFPTEVYIVVLFLFKFIWTRDEHTVNRIKAMPTPKYAAIVYTALGFCTLAVFTFWLSGISNGNALTAVIDVAGGTFAAVVCLILPGLFGVNYHRLALARRQQRLEQQRQKKQQKKKNVPEQPAATFSPMIEGGSSGAENDGAANNTTTSSSSSNSDKDLEPLSWQDHYGSWAVLCFGLFAIIAVPLSIILDATDVI